MQETLRRHPDRGTLTPFTSLEPYLELTDFSASEVLENQKSVHTYFGIQTNNEELDLPYINWIPKVHKNPYKHGFIAGSSKSSTKPLSVYSQNCLHILSKVFGSTVRQPTQEVGTIRCGSSRIKKKLLDHLIKSPNFNLITSIKSFDFSTLYTTIPY